MANYEVWLTGSTGNRLALLDDYTGLEYVLAAGEVGECKVELPGDWSSGLFQADRKLEVWRKPEGGALALERAFLISGIAQETDRNGTRTLSLAGVDGNDLLRRRIVAYASDSTGAWRTAAADSMLKDVVRLNLSTGSTDTDRSLSTGLFTIEAKSSAGPSVVKKFSRRDVLGVCQEICEATKQTTGPEVYFDVVSPTPATYELRTYTGQPGIDHTYPSGNSPVLLGLEYGNLAEPAVSEDHSEEVTVIYGGGAGQGSDQIVYEIEDSLRSARSPFGRREAWKSVTNEATSSAVMDEARSALAGGRPWIRFSGRLVDSPGTQYGIHWRQGDRVTATYNGQSYDCLIQTLRVRVDSRGEEVEARLEYEEQST